MNLVLLVNSYNLAEITAFVEATARLQNEKTPGAIAVVHQGSLSKSYLETLVAPILPVFSAAVTYPVFFDDALKNDGRLSSLFTQFLFQVYTRFPGPWLIVDGPGVPKVDNFLTLLDKQHLVLGGTVSGRVCDEAVSRIPVGPTVFSLPIAKVSWMLPSAESWRSYLKYTFARCGFAVVPADDYLFEFPSTPVVSGIPEPQNPQIPQNPAPAPEPVPQVDEPIIPPPLPEPHANPPAEIEEVASPQLESDQAAPETDQVPIEDQGYAEGVLTYDEMEREDLFLLIEARGLDKPHHALGKTKLIAILHEDDERASSHAVIEALREEAPTA